jgi:hypothetical protein
MLSWNSVGIPAGSILSEFSAFDIKMLSQESLCIIDLLYVGDPCKIKHINSLQIHSEILRAFID